MNLSCIIHTIIIVINIYIYNKYINKYTYMCLTYYRNK